MVDPFAGYRDAAGAFTGPFEQTVGYDVELREGEIVIRLDVDGKHVSQYGVAHGGVTLTLLDTVGGVAVWYRVRPQRMATINLACQFLAPAPIGPVLATATIDRLGNAVAHTRMALHERDADGPVLATAIASYRLFR
ncbi:MAG: PaaI family thioesterase [Pseudomonadota bacterium]